MKKSIKIRLAVTYIVIMCLSLAVMLGVNSLFLEKYYLARKTDSLKNATVPQRMRRKCWLTCSLSLSFPGENG